MKWKIFLVCAISSMLLLVSGCVEQEDEDEGGETEANLASMEFYISDAPADDFKSINVTFSEIRLHSNETGWVNLTLETTVVDLIELHMNNLEEKLGSAEIETGNYSKLWIVVDNATGVLNDTGETVYLKVPSDTLKIQHLFDIRQGNNTNMITVEIDLNNSIVNPGHSDKYILLPVISALRVKHANGTTAQIRDKNKLNDKTENRAPAVDVVANGTRGKPIMVSVNETITFNASETYDTENDEINYTWDFDDENIAYGEVVSHSYNETGNYTVTLIVSDGELESTEEIHVIVKKGNNGQGNGGQS